MDFGFLSPIMDCKEGFFRNDAAVWAVNMWAEIEEIQLKLGLVVVIYT